MARRTFSSYKASVVHALGANPATGVDKGEVVNDALKYLSSLHPWRWRRGGPVSLSLTANQNYVELPADFGEEIVFTYPASFALQMIRTTVEQIERMRAWPIVASFGFSYYYAINPGQTEEELTVRSGGTVDPSDPTLGLSLSVAELYPTPTTDVTDALQLVYLRDTPRLEAEDDIPAIPEWMDYALDLLCRGFAMTLEDDNPNNSAMVAFSQILPQLRQRDGSGQSRLGVMNGGLYPKAAGISPFYPSSIGDPTTV
ncbi:MAG: hypothetical protein AB7V18_19445 [Pyrinomonadaceae bacterium]